MAGYSVTFSVVDQATKQIDQINRRVAAMRAPFERMSKQVQRFVDVTGLRKVAQGFEWIGRAAQSVLRTMIEIVPVLGTITGAATIAGMTKLISSFSNWSQQLVSTADSMGVTTQELQQFQDATRLAGGNANDMTEAMRALYKVQTDFARNQATPEMIGWLNKLGINLKDVNGHWRNMADLMPEVIQKIADIKNPGDRAAASAALLGDANMNLVETFRRSHQSFLGWFNDASRYTELSDKQKDQLQSFAEAQGRVGTAFDHLGQQIAAMLAEHFTPLLDGLSKFVEKHTPDILNALEQLTNAFADWVSGITWDDIENGLKWVEDTLRDIRDIMRDIKGYWDDVKAVGDWLNSIQKGANDAGKATHDWITDTARKLGIINRDTNPQPGFGGAPLAPAAPAAPGGRPGGPPGTESRQPGPVPGTEARPYGLAEPPPGQLPPTLASLPGDYSSGDYGTRANNPGNMNYASWQHAAGRFSYQDPQTGGQHTMAVYNTMEEGVADTYKLLQKNQEKYGKTLAGALHGWAENSYIPQLARSMGVDPNAEFDISKADPQSVARMMGEQFRHEGRRGSHTATPEQIVAGVNLARGDTPNVAVAANAPPAAVPPAAAPPNGVVDVNITHKNPPPDAAVTASGSGSVNVAPPRVEHQQFASI